MANHTATTPDILKLYGFRTVQMAYWFGLQAQIEELENVLDDMPDDDECRADTQAELEAVQQLSDQVRASQVRGIGSARPEPQC